VLGVDVVVDRGNVELGAAGKLKVRLRPAAGSRSECPHLRIEMWETRRSEAGTGDITLPVSKRLTSSVTNLGNVYPAQLLVDGVDDPVDMGLLAVEKMMERPIIGIGEYQRHVAAYSQG